MKSTVIFEKISHISLYALVVLLPLWFLPVTQNVLGYQKQALLIVLVFAGFAAWLAKQVQEGELRVQKSWLLLAGAGVLFAAGISTIFSLWQYGSFWGWPLDVTDNFLSLFGFFLFAILLSHVVKDTKQLSYLLSGFVVSGTVATLYALAQMKGIAFLPFEFSGVKTFNTIGSTNSVGIFAAFLLPLAWSLASFASRVWRGVLWAAAFLLFGSLLLLNFEAAWIVMITGLVVLLGFDMWNARKREQFGRISLPMIFILVGFFFLVVNGVGIPGAPERQAEISPTWRGELAIVQGMAGENPLSLVVGSGPGTFVFDYTKFRDASLNDTIFWSARFEKGAAEILDWLVTKGTLGVFALLGMIGLGLFLGIRRLLTEEDSAALALGAGILASFAGVSLSFFLYPANFVFWFTFWILASCLVFLTGKKMHVISFKRGPSYVGFAGSLGLLIVLMAEFGLFIVGAQKYYAEVEYTRGIQTSRQENIEEAIAKVEHATELNASADVYWRDLGQLYLEQANQIVTNQTLPEDVRRQQIEVAVDRATRAVQQATNAAPRNVANWNVRGLIYRNLIGALPEAEKFAVTSYEQALALEPASPFPLTELGRVKILSSQAQEAIEYLEKAITLKSDYAPAHYLIAVAYDQMGNQAEAIRKLEDAKLVTPGDTGLAFQLGVLYYRQQELGKARDEFERAKGVNLRYSNARYMLGLVYDRLDRRQDAIAEFAAVAALNPDNQEVRTILSNLAAGRAALDGIGQPSTPPIQDNPEEIEQEE